MVLKFSREKKKNDFPGKWKEEKKGRERGLRNRGAVVEMGKRELAHLSSNSKTQVRHKDRTPFQITRKIKKFSYFSRFKTMLKTNILNV